MNTKIATLIAVLLLSLHMIGSISSGTSSDPDFISDNDGQDYMPWNRDSDRNGLDDLLDDRIHAGYAGTVNIYVDYDHYPDINDHEILEAYLDISYVPRYIDTLCALDVPIENLQEIKLLPGVIMIEEQLPMMTKIDVSNKAIKARGSSVYSNSNAWGEFGYDGFGITVAVLDTGVDDAHPTFTERYLGGYDATTGIETNPGDSNGHGTHVAGVIMGQGGGDDDPNNNFTGVAPGSKLVDVKVQQTTTGLGQDFVRGVEWCIDQEENTRVWDDTQQDFNGIDLISVSLSDGSNDDGSSATAEVVNSAVEAGIMVVCAVGDSDGNAIGAPASADRAISVAAIDDGGTISRNDDVLWPESNRGPRADDGDGDHMDELKPEVVAPGVLIASANYNHEVADDYVNMTGTSQATPHVTGILALIKHSKPHLEVDSGTKNIKLILRRTSEMHSAATASWGEVDSEWNDTYGWGMVDAYKAVRYAVTAAKVSVARIKFDKEDANEGDPQRVDYQIGEANGIDIDNGVIRIYEGTEEEKNLIEEKDLNGLRGGTTYSDSIFGYITKGGENKIIVTVTDMDGAGDTQDEATITANYKPIAEIYTDDRSKEDYTIEPDQTVSFHGNASYDPEHHDLLYKFDYGDETPATDFTTTSYVEHSFKNGRYDVKLNVRDEYGATSKYDKVVITANLDPTAIPGDDMMAGRGDPVTFDGTAFNDGDHDDPNDAIVLYEWDFDGNSEYEFEDDESGYATHTYDDLETYTAYLRVTDKWGAQSEESITVEVVEGKPPHADAGDDMVSVVDEPVQFSGTGTDEDGTIEQYKWNFGDGSGWRVYDNGKATHAYETSGEFKAKFMVIDNDENEVEDHLYVRVHRPPNAVISEPIDDETYVSDEEITFDASESKDPDNTVLTYEWNSDIQGLLGTEKTFTKLLQYGRHKINLTVTDADGASDSALVTIAVKDASDTPPTVTIISPANNSWHQEGEEIRFRVSGDDPDGDELNFTWEVGEDSYSGTTLQLNLPVGTHEIHAFADDGRGGIGSSWISVNINKQPIAVITGLDFRYNVGEYINFDASDSTDPDGHKIVEYIWHSDKDGTLNGNSTQYANFDKVLSQGDHNITLTVIDEHGGTGTTNTIVQIRDANDYNIELESSITSGTVTFFEPAIFTIRATNDGFQARTVLLTNSSMPDGWSVSYRDDELGDIPGGVWGLDPGEEGKPYSKDFQVIIECPRNALLGQSIPIKITGIMNADDGIEDSITLQVAVGEFRDASITINAETSLVDEAGDSLEFELIITNKGNTIDTFVLDHLAPSGWKITFDPSEPLNLDPGANVQVVLKVTTPSNGKQGEVLDLEIFVISNGDSSVNRTVITRIKLLSESSDDSPGFEMSFLIASFAISMILLARKKKRMLQ